MRPVQLCRECGSLVILVVDYRESCVDSLRGITAVKIYLYKGENEVNNKIFLVAPDIIYKDQFFVMVSQYENTGEADYYELYKESMDGFEQYVDNLHNYAQGINIPEDWVPYHTYWLTNVEGQLLGVIRVRTSIDNDYVEKYAGHIGYDVSPLHRQRGYGREILRLGLDKARMLGLHKVLITCDCDNEGSIKIIESNGGVFESEIYKESNNKILRRYWVNL